jgi:hypothetical protein
MGRGIGNDDFDYQAYSRETPPDPAKTTVTRERGSFGASPRCCVRQLREWLAAQGIKEMLRTEIQLAVQPTLSAAAIPACHRLN